MHGYNVNFPEALFRLAQLTSDGGFEGAPIAFIWASEGKPSAYIADRDAATVSRDQLAGLLSSLAAQSGSEHITVVGHDTGAWLTMETLRQLKLTQQNQTLRKLDVVPRQRTSTSMCSKSNYPSSALFRLL